MTRRQHAQDVAKRTFDQYIRNVVAYVNDEQISNPYTGDFIDPDERFMRAIELNVEHGIPEQAADDWRRMILARIGSNGVRGRLTTWDDFSPLTEGILAYLGVDEWFFKVEEDKTDWSLDGF